MAGDHETTRVVKASEVRVVKGLLPCVTSGSCSTSPRCVCMWVQADVKKARIPIANRDYCVDVLIPLNECRRKNYYLPWKCEEERHAYELCQYKEYKLRTQK